MIEASRLTRTLTTATLLGCAALAGCAAYKAENPALSEYPASRR